MKALQNIYINSGNAILVIVDMENDFSRPAGKKFPSPRDRTVPPVITAIQGFTERARSAGIPIIYIQSVRTLQEPDFTVFGSSPYVELGTWGAEIIDELKPHEGDIIVQKFSHDAFHNTNLDEVLQKLVPDPTRHYAIVTGGGMIPFFWGRIEETYEPSRQQKLIGRVMPKPLLEYFSHFYYDTAVGGSAAAIRCAYEVFGADQIVFATDYPWGPGGGDSRLAKYPNIIKSLGLSGAENKKIFEDNARRLLNLL